MVKKYRVTLTGEERHDGKLYVFSSVAELAACVGSGPSDKEGLGGGDRDKCVTASMFESANW
ncbi:MAG: hypothetical protein LBT46_09010 [Planctomycetaceae bacterium]|nr:hypothetical protein [Planctomycetaceae bacterium]